MEPGIFSFPPYHHLAIFDDFRAESQKLKNPKLNLPVTLIPITYFFAEQITNFLPIVSHWSLNRSA